MLLAGLAIGGFFFYQWYINRPIPTIVGWQPVVSTLAGDGAPGSTDGQTGKAQFADPFGVAVDNLGNLYIADAGDNNRIRKIALDGQVTTFAGSSEGFRDGQGTNATFNTPSAIAIDSKNNIYVADTGNNAIRKISPTGAVETLAGDGTAGSRDGPARSAQFNGPVGVAVDKEGNVYVADTYNDRIREITIDGQVKTLAGGAVPGYQDGSATAALFDTPCGLAVAPNGDLLIADTGNNAIRKLTKEGQVSTHVGLPTTGVPENESYPLINSPTGLAMTHDGFLYVTSNNRGRIYQVSPDGSSRLLAGEGIGFANGAGQKARFSNPTGIAVDRRGSLYVSDAANYLVRKLSVPAKDIKTVSADITETLPRLSPETLHITDFPWPVAPQRQWHEVAGTMGEVRGSYDGESRDHFHSGLDVQGAMGTRVLSVYDEKVVNPLNSYGFESLNEGFHVGIMTYFHLRVGRDEKDDLLTDLRFIALRDDQGKIRRVRIKRGTRFRVGDILGTINRMYHVHMNFGPSGGEINPLNLPLIGFSDKVNPTIERDGIHIVDSGGQQLKQQRSGRLVVHGDVSIVVDAYDQVDGNQARRKLGLYKLGYQILKADGSAAPGFDQPRMTMEFNRLSAADSDAVKIAYADSSGITVYGNAVTKFLYVVTNTFQDGKAKSGVWHASELPSGNYVLRIIAQDFSGNQAVNGRDLAITIE